MCGICGIYDPSGVSERQVALMRDRMLSRGPDDAGTYLDPSGQTALGHRRLSILDLSAAGRQPLANEEGDVHIVVNGEFYGFEAVRTQLQSRGHSLRSRSDSEIAVHLYEEAGDAFLEQVNGMYALAVWDAKRDRILLARDRVGKKPLYYAHKGERFAFASTVDPLLELDWVSRELDPVALDSYLALGYVPGDMCIFRDVRKLPAAHTARFECATGALSTGRYWDLPEAVESPCRRDDALDSLERLIEVAVRERLVADVGVGVFLSGGVDSSVVAAVAGRVSSDPIKTFTIGFGESSHDERPYARMVAKHIGSIHSELEVTKDMLGLVDDLPGQYGEPFADSSALPTYLVSRLTREHVTVALSGDGGDELFGGYNWYSWVLNGVRLSPLLGPFAPLVRGVGGLLPEGTRGRHHLIRLGLSVADQYIDRTFLMSAEERGHLLGEGLAEHARAQTPEKWVAAQVTADVLQWMTSADFRRYLVDDVLVKVDRASMSVPLEVRCPLLDKRVVEFAFGLPASIRFDPRRRKALLKDIARRALPAGFPLERKQGFSVPLALWMRGDLGDRTVDIVRSSPACMRLVRPEVVAGWLSDHRSGRRDNSSRLWSILMLALWAERYLA